MSHCTRYRPYCTIYIVIARLFVNLHRSLRNVGDWAWILLAWPTITLQWLRARMPDNVPAKAVMRMACDVRDGVPPFPNWRRPRGRPPTTWLHQICSDCGVSTGDALNCAQYRAVWRTYATASSASRWRRRRLRSVTSRIAVTMSDFSTSTCHHYSSISLEEIIVVISGTTSYTQSAMSRWCPDSNKPHK